jgi:hypothetical protein
MKKVNLRIHQHTSGSKAAVISTLFVQRIVPELYPYLVCLFPLSGTLPKGWDFFVLAIAIP